MNLAEELTEPATKATSSLTKNSARILAAMQRFDDTEWMAARTIQADRVRSTWATAAAVREALEHLVRAGLLDYHQYLDPNNIQRPRYRLNAAGAAVVIHASNTVKELRRPKGAEKTFDELWAEAMTKVPEGKLLVLVDQWAFSSAQQSSLF